MAISNNAIDFVAAYGKLQVDLSSMPWESKERAKNYIDLSKEALKLLNDWIEMKKKEQYLSAMEFSARKHGVKKVVVFPSIGGTPLFRMYGENVQEFAREMGIALLDEKLDEKTRKEIYSISDEYGRVIYEA